LPQSQRLVNRKNATNAKERLSKNGNGPATSLFAVTQSLPLRSLRSLRSLRLNNTVPKRLRAGSEGERVADFTPFIILLIVAGVVLAVLTGIGAMLLAAGLDRKRSALWIGGTVLIAAAVLATLGATGIFR
jgi:hypothetical protein